MRRYTKDSVQFHRDYYGPSRPAVNVKMYNLPRVSLVEERFNCTEEIAEQALNFAIECQQEQFWADVESLAREILGRYVQVWQEGRSGGWLVVEGLPEVETWDAVQLAKWRKFERNVSEDVKYRLSLETLCEDIEANRWAEEGAERYNYVERADGDHCIVDLKASGELCKHCGHSPR